MVERHVIIVHVRDPFHINTARGYVSRNQELQLRLPERTHYLLPLRLGQITVQFPRHIPFLLQRLVKLLRPYLRTAENHAEIRHIPLHHVQKGTLARSVRTFDDELADLLAGNFRFRGNPHVLRLLHVSLREIANLLRHGRREQHRLAAARNRADNRLHLFEESHVQHLIRFVQHQHPHLAQLERAAPHMIQQPPRCANDKLAAALQLAELTLHVLPAVCRKNGHALSRCGKLSGLSRNLDGELPCRCDDERLGAFDIRADLLHDRKQESKRLSRSCLRLGNQIMSLQQLRNRSFLNRGWVHDSLITQNIIKSGQKAPILKSCQMNSPHSSNNPRCTDIVPNISSTNKRPLRLMSAFRPLYILQYNMFTCFLHRNQAVQSDVSRISVPPIWQPGAAASGTLDAETPADHCPASDTPPVQAHKSEPTRQDAILRPYCIP